MAAEAKYANLLYVVDIGDDDVDVFTYPAGKLVGTLTGFNQPNAACSDKAGNVFIINTFSLDILEYAHGATRPKAVLKGDPEYPNDCAVDPATGDLAVTNTNAAQGSIVIFKHARGQPDFIKTGVVLFQTYYCAYDDRGNLYVDGFNNLGDVQLGEMTKGRNYFSAITLNIKVGWPGGVQWSGDSLVVGDQFADKFIKEPYANVAYKLKIRHRIASITATVPLVGGGDVAQFWIDGNTLIGPDAQNEFVGYWRDHAGGGPPGKVLANFYVPVGAAVSEARR